MRKLIKAGLVFGLLLLFAGNVWALPTAGDKVIMTTDPGLNYGMQVIDGAFYHTFCVEKNEYFNPTGIYDVDSVVDYATEGGNGYANVGGDDLGASTATKDYISQKSLWLYASFWDNKFGTQDQALATKVQNAIWYMEDEIVDNADWLIFSDGETDFSVTGWDIKIVNLSQVVNDVTVLKQSQLVGVPVPEPATMVLFGIGLLGLAGIGRKRIQE